MDKNRSRLGLARAAVLACALVTCASLYAHHGTSISYDSSREWTREVVVTDFQYINPHPTMTFDIIDEAGSVEHWVSELRTNPAAMLRQGWGRRRTEEALGPGTTVTLTVQPSRAGGNSGLVIRIVTADGVDVGINPPGFGGGGRGQGGAP